MLKNLPKPAILLFSLTLPLTVGFLGSLGTTPSIDTWYATLTKPGLNPPNWIFGPVWTALYLLMGLSLYLVITTKLKSKKLKKEIAYQIFAFQLFLNLIWSFIFFTFQSPSLAIIIISLLWLGITATIYEFKKINRNAAALLIPYHLWVTFAAYLNFSIWVLN